MYTLRYINDSGRLVTFWLKDTQAVLTVVDNLIACPEDIEEVCYNNVWVDIYSVEGALK